VAAQQFLGVHRQQIASRGMVVGFRKDSDSDSAGNSIGKPPASDAALDVTTRD